MTDSTYEHPSSTDVEEGVVIIDGPGGTAFSITPDTAHESGDRLKASAGKARKQRNGKLPPFGSAMTSLVDR